MKEDTYQLSKENFRFLMDCINEYWDRSAPPRNGLLYFIKDSLIAERVVTKYQPTTIEYFKAFFCNEVLQLHEGREELNIAEYENYFDNRRGKKNAVFAEHMNRYLDRDANVDYIQKEFPECDTASWKTVAPILLINRLQEVAHQCLKEYFLMDEEAFTKYEKRGIRLERKKILSYVTVKKKLYRRFICAACLYEIFTDKFLGNSVWDKCISSMNTVLEYVRRFHEIQKEYLANLEQWRKCGTRSETTGEISEQIRHFTERTTVLSEEMSSYMNEADRAAGCVYFYVVHAKYITALYAVISMVEFTNINTRDDTEIPKKWKQPDLFQKMEDLFFESDCKTLFIEDISMNKNSCDVYGKVMAAITEEKIIQELCSKSGKTQEKALELICMYFNGVLMDADLEDADFSTALNLLFKKSLKDSKEESAI